MLWTEFILALKLSDDGKRVELFAVLPHHTDTLAPIHYLPPVLFRIAYWMSTDDLPAAIWGEHPQAADARRIPVPPVPVEGI